MPELWYDIVSSLWSHIEGPEATDARAESAEAWEFNERVWWVFGLADEEVALAEGKRRA